ncbi:glycosyltransferase [Arsenicitalea aurantiaca]|uniref:Glycosyltransferase n=2 Tax=Arsenicitalea aurantiaca TaxID=1783274 RepID=A0A433XK94_9HYPH|nr:glycosyltransferase [Arsenicitalea aurantiaca]
MRAILGPAVTSDAEARDVLEAALVLEVDPIVHCAHRHGLGHALALERAAEWAGLVFSPFMPETIAGSARIARLDALAEVRSLRGHSEMGDVTYCTPRFTEFLNLRERLAEAPHLAARIRIVPPAILRAELARSNADRLMEEARERLARRWPSASAHRDLPMLARLVFVSGLFLVVLLAALSPYLERALLVPLLALLIVAPAALRFAALFVRPRPGEDPPSLPPAELPLYSVLIPLRDEANMVPLLEQAMRAIDYPPEKLDIKFVVEAKSRETVAAVEKILADPRFELVRVPDGPPRTKPKALDYALPLARGQFVVVYDAEDIPDPDQLRLAAARFAADPGLDCLQAELVIDNGSESWLTAMFSAEYGGLFGLLLPLLARWKLPMPLGGTSNHFRLRSLRELGGWDAFNVTEDADLGVRMARLRYRCETFVSRTREEAPITLDAWMAQRTRWMKGWMQTFIVHNRNPVRFLRDIGWRGFLAFQIYVGGLIVSALLHTVFMASLALFIVNGDSWFGLSDGWDLAYIAILVLGYGGSFALAIAGLVRLGQKRLIFHQLLLPVYWVLHSAATLRAARELITHPYFWAKTRHGATRMRRDFREQTHSVTPAPVAAPPVQP